MTAPDGAPPSRAPIAVALDTADLPTARRWAAAVTPYVRAVKVGLELWCRHGPAAVRAALADAAVGTEVFLDLKLHDIPATVAGAAAGAAELHPRWLTVHASGGAAMIRAAAQAAPEVEITAVTVLTSLAERDLAAVGLAGPSVDAARRLAGLAVAAGARAVVCSPLEVAAVHREVGPGVTLITPGVRSAGTAHQDQARVASPEQALAAGADLLVVGRSVTAAPDVAAAVRELRDALGAPAGNP